jgi:hypothetical protein
MQTYVDPYNFHSYILLILLLLNLAYTTTSPHLPGCLTPLIFPTVLHYFSCPGSSFSLNVLPPLPSLSLFLFFFLTLYFFYSFPIFPRLVEFKAGAAAVKQPLSPVPSPPHPTTLLACCALSGDLPQKSPFPINYRTLVPRPSPCTLDP